MKKNSGVLAALVLLAIAACIFVLPGTAQAASTSDLTFELNSAGDGYVVSDCDQSASGELVIPTTYNGLPVIRVDEDAFYGCSDLTSITIPDSVTFIDDYAFYNCTGLTSISVGKQVTRIGAAAFGHCTSLTSITIPDSVTYIEDSAFLDCSSLISIVIGKGLTGMGDDVFYDCSGLTSLQVKAGNTAYHSSGNCIIHTNSKTLVVGCKTSKIPSDGSVTSIDSEAFRNRQGLASITIPGSVISIGGYAFSHCSDLTNVIIGNGVISIGEYAFNWCGGLTSITIPDSVTSIGKQAFTSCKSLTSITIPDSVTSIGLGAFSGCSNLTDVYITDPSAWCKISFGDNAMSNLTEYAKCLHIVDGQGNEVKTLVFDKTVTSIPNQRFMFFKNITSITIPDSITSIGGSSFFSCTSLTSITIPDSLTTVGGYAFYGCNKLSSVIYCGTQAQWDAIEKNGGNDSLTNATIQFHNYENGVCSICAKTECEALGHAWLAADCETPKTCNRCQATEGNALGHNMQETPAIAPTCETVGRTAILTCTNGCGKTEGGEEIPAKGHEAGAAATCETARTCIHCDHIFEAALGHDWTAANCTTPKICKRCQITEGEAPGHKYENGICSVCQNYAVFISVSNSTLYRGDTVTVTVSTSAIKHCTIGGFLFSYDTNIFEYVSGKALVSGFTGAGVSTVNGQVAGYFMDGDETVRGDIFQITLKVKDTASFGSHIISGEPSLNATDGAVPCSTEAATVTVACSHSYGDWIDIDEIWHKHICTICSYEETVYVEYTVTFQYADGTVISAAQYHYGDAVAEPQTPPALEANCAFVGWDKEIESCTGNATYTAVFKKYLAGDIDGNDAVTYNDAVYLLLHTLFGAENYPLNGAQGDIDGNGEVTQEDAVYLLLHTLFGEVFYPLKKD